MTEAEIARAGAALLDRAGHPAAGQDKPSKKDQRAAARARAATGPAWPRPDGLADTAAVAEENDGAGPVAEVIPLPVFDPFAEADKRW